MKKKDYKSTLLESWESTYKKGQLTFYLFLALKEGEKYVGEIKEFIESITQEVITCEDQSLYRSLRKYYDLEIVTYTMRDGDRGPDRKYYRLTALGEQLLAEFIERNIAILNNNEIRKLLK